MYMRAGRIARGHGCCCMHFPRTLYLEVPWYDLVREVVHHEPLLVPSFQVLFRKQLNNCAVDHNEMVRAR